MHGTIEKRGRKAAAKAVRARLNAGSRRRSKARATARVSDQPQLLKISPRLNGALAKLEAKSGKPRHYHVRRALERYVEDTWDVLLADEALKSSRRTYSAVEVKKYLGLAN